MNVMPNKTRQLLFFITMAHNPQSIYLTYKGYEPKIVPTVALC